MSRYKTIRTEMTVEREGAEVELDISGTYIPGYPETREEPAEYPCCEDIEAKQNGVPFVLTEAEEDLAQEKLLASHAEDCE